MYPPPHAQTYVISGPSGGGKTSLIQQLIREHHDLTKVISHTTRTMRPTETDGIDYFFISEAEFKQMIADQAFLEYAFVYGHFYGTAKQTVVDLSHGQVDMILELDWQGANQIKQNDPQAILIYIMPTSISTLANRLKSRNQDNQATIAARMQVALNEIKQSYFYDYWVINENFEHAAMDLSTIIRNQRLRTARQRQNHPEIVSRFQID